VDDVMRRDPRSEVMEQLEPNVVGGLADGGIRLATQSSKTNPTVNDKASSKRAYSATKKRHKVNAFPLRVLKTK
jgi:hypothetical protein